MNNRIHNTILRNSAEGTRNAQRYKHTYLKMYELAHKLINEYSLTHVVLASDLRIYAYHKDRKTIYDIHEYIQSSAYNVKSSGVLHGIDSYALVISVPKYI